MEKLHSDLLSRFPFSIEIIQKDECCYLVKDLYNRKYHLMEVSSSQYRLYKELCKCRKIEKAIYECREKEMFYLLFPCVNRTSEEKAAVIKMLPMLEEVFDDFAFSITLKKEHLANLEHIYKVLDNRFTYFELRIREIETMPYKDDIAWVILSKYYNLLDARVYLYDLQQDIFSFIDKNNSVEYGLVFRQIGLDNFKNQWIEPSFSVYYAPKAMLLCRMFMSYDHLEIYGLIKDRLKKFDEFNQKYFCFMSIYIYILSIHFDSLLTPYNVNNYIQITKKINRFIKEFGDYMK